MTYIEPFLGGGAILRMKRPAAISIGMDIDFDVVKAFDQGTTPNLAIRQDNALTYLQCTYFSPRTFIYCDPPYLFETRSCRRPIYNFELSLKDHRALLNTIKALPCMVMISGYPNTIYDDALSNWWTATFMTTNRGGGHVTEKLWMNYPPPIRLHDYRYLGNTFREREKIKRQRQRWVMKLEKMDEVKRHALAAAIAEIEETGRHRPEERTAPARPETKEEVINALCEGFDIPQPTQHMVVNPAPGGLQDHNILCPQDPIDKKIDGDPLPALCNKCGWPDPIAMATDTESMEPTIADLRNGRTRRLLKKINNNINRKQPATEKE